MTSKNSGTQHIQVSVRLRPLNEREKKDQAHNTISVANKEVIVKDYPLENLTKKYTFDKVFGPESKQVEIYKGIAMPLINEVISGYNCTVFAYGQTGTGKTFTMEGCHLDDYNLGWAHDTSAGIVPRTLSHLIDTLRLQQLEYTLRVSYVELYNEELFDLLSPNEDTSKIRIYEDSNKKGSIIIHGVEEVTINNKREVFKILEKGSAKRQKASTLLNAESSRSHTVFTITVHIKENNMDGEELLKIGKLNLVDLAGSENISRSGAQEKRAREAGNINQSLLTLGRVITALVERAPHIPYRESKLTRLLQESLGGRTKTSIIATISPSSYHLEETISTLEYAYRAKNITNKPEVNQKLTKKTLIKEYTSEIERLRQDLLATREKNGVYIAHENYCALQEQLAEQEKEICSKIEQITLMNERHEKNLILFDELNMKIESCQMELDTTKADLTEKQNDLKETRKALKDAHQAFQEQMHLVSKVEETEKKLKDQATKLLSVANESTLDISKLHDKLERKSALESLNKNLSATFLDGFTDKTLKFKSDIFTNLEKKEQYLNSQKQRIDNIMEKVFDNLNEQREKNRNLYQDMECFQEDSSSQITSQSELISSMKRSIIENNNINLNHFSSIKSLITTTFQELHQNFIEERKEINQLISDFNTNYASEMYDYTNAFIENLNKKFSQLSQYFEEKIQEKTTLINKNKEEYIRQMCERDYLNEEINKHLLEIFELNKVKESLSSKEHTYVSNQNILIDKVGCFRDIISTELNENKNIIKTFVDKLSEKYCKQICEISDFKEKEENSIDKLKEKLINHQKELDTIVNAQSKTHEDNFNKWDSDMNILTTNLSNHMQFISDFTMKSATLIKDRTFIDKDKDMFQEKFNEIISDNSKLNEQCKESRELISTQVNDLENNLEQFLSKELKQDQTTGQTPQRKEFSYPLELAETSPHQRIIQRFRQLHLQNLNSEDSILENYSNESNLKFSLDKSKSTGDLTIGQAEKENSKQKLNSKNNAFKKRNKSPSPTLKVSSNKKPLINITNNA